MTEPVRVGIVSDTHGYLDPRIVDSISGCDFVVHAGDIGGAQVLEELQVHCRQVVAVTGNNDSAARWLPSEAQVVTSLTSSAEVPLPGGVLVAEHGEQHGFHAPCHASLRRQHPDARVIVYGHTHLLTCDQSESIWVVNPGAAGRTRTNGGPSCLLLTASVDSEWRIEVRRFATE